MLRIPHARCQRAEYDDMRIAIARQSGGVTPIQAHARMQLAEYARIPPKGMLKLTRSSAYERVRDGIIASLRTMEAMRREIGFVFVQSMPRWSLRPRRGAPRVGGRHRTSRRYWIDVCAKACTCSCLQAERGGQRGHSGCRMVQRRVGVASTAPGVPRSLP